MKPTRIFATASLIISSVALITAASISSGDEPGVVRMASFSPQVGTTPSPTPTPDPMGSGGVATMNQPMDPSGLYPQPGPYAPYFERSFGATESVPSGYYQPQQPFGPIMMFESNLNKGLGYDEGYQRFNARVPYHIVPNTTVLIGDVSASVTFDGDPLGNAGTIYRNYDSLRNRIFGWNAYVDYDQGYTNQDWYRGGVGYESLGKYIDFRANGYFMMGDNSAVLNSEVVGNLILSGNGVYRVRNETRENAYSGVDAEVGGPLPILGKYGMNLYAGAYFFTNSHGSDTVGFQARWQALVTQNITVNTYLTSDDTFGTNSWVGLQYQIPNYKSMRTLKPGTVRERLQDPVYRNNRIQTQIELESQAVAQLNCDTGLAYNILYVDPNASASGTGTFENPFSTLAAANAANNAGVNILRVTPRDDASGTNLTLNGGMSLFDNQALISSNSDYELFRIGSTPFFIPGTGSTGPGPLLTDPNMIAGGSIVRLANNNTIVGMQFDASNAAGTIFGNGVSNPLPVTDVNLTNNTFANYVVGADLQDVSGRVIVDGNTFTGRPVTSAIRSTYGLKMSVAGASTASLLLRNNLATDNEIAGLSVTANAGSTLNADDPDGVAPVIPPGDECYVLLTTNTGITNNTTIGNGNGIEVIGDTGSTINAVVENNLSTGNTGNGFLARTDGGEFNLASLRNNVFSNNTENGAFLHYLNGGVFRSVSEDQTEDLNLNGILDPGEDTNANGVLDVSNGILDLGEDTNGNGLLDEGIVSNTFTSNSIVGLCIFGEGSGEGFFDIGGESELLGNTFITNNLGGMAADLTGTAEATINAINNSVFGFGVPTSDDVIRTGFSQNTLAANDDGFTGLINTGFTMNFFGQVFNDLTVNNNGNVTFNGPLATFTPFPLLTTATPMIAPFFADVDTRLGNIVSYGTGTVGSRQAFGVNYLDVRHFSVFGTNQGLPTNSFQMVLIDRSDVSAGDFDIEFNYDRILWEAGEASGSDPQGLGGSTARVGWTNGVDRAFELPGSAIPGAFLDSGPASTSLVNNSLNSGTLGRYVFESRNGNISGGAVVNNADGMSVRLADNAILHPSRFINNTVNQSRGNGISVTASDNAVASNVIIQGNDVTSNRGNGVALTADGTGASITAVVGGNGNNVLSGQSFPQGNRLTNNGTSGAGDGFNATARNGGLIRGGIFGNDALDNGGNGIGMVVDDGGTLDFGTPASDRLISGNTITGNNGAGIRTVSNVSPTSVGVINAVVRDNDISRNASGGIVSNLNGPNNNPPAPPLVLENNVLNLTVGGPALTDANTINANGDVGIGVEVTGNGRANVDISNATITNTTDGPDPVLNGDGINLRRADAAFLNAVITNVTATGNAGDGLDVDIQGNDKNDPNQPATGTANTVTWNQNNFSNNVQNGARFRTRGDSVLIADGQTNTLNANGQNGILVQTSQSSSFGDPTDGLPPGRRVIFDGNTITENGVDGVQILATETSRALVEITSTQIPAASGAHAALNSLGNTSISRNGRDGVHIETTGGRSDILITSGTATTTIDGNGTALDANGDPVGGNGIRWDASGTSEGIVRVTRTLITNNIAGATEDVNGNGVLDPGEDLNGNADIDVVDGDGIQANFSNDATATLIVGNVGEGNFIQSNEDDGIAITATGSDVSGNPRPVITITDNTIGGTSNGLTAGNAGDGVSLQVVGGTATGIAPGAVDNTITAASPQTDLLAGRAGVTESGAVPQFTMSDNLVSNNGHRGVNLLLNGASGTRDRENGASIFDPVRITVENNTIVSNGDEGIFYRADSDMNQSRFIFLPNFPDPPVANLDNLNYSPFRAEFFSLNAGSVNGNTAYLAPYMNLRTVQNSFLTLTGNTIQNNGVNTVTGEGIRIEVGTGSYVAADIQDNTFGGNLQEDVVTSSFLSAGNTFDSVDTSGDLTFDYVYLDDTAQLDMRFQNNSGNQIAPSDVGAVYTNFDTLKSQFLGPIGVVNRDVSFFQVDNGPALNNPNNTFINFGITQDIQAAFTAGNYNLRAAADPAFPNIGFAPFLP